MSINTHAEFNKLKALTKSLTITIRNRQAEYFSKHQRYFQGLRIPTIGKLDGLLEAEISPSMRPSDQEASWSDFAPTDFKVGGMLPVHINISVYSSQAGEGWVLTIEFWQDLGPDNYGNAGDHWTWQHNEGPEARAGIWDDWFVQSDDEM